MMPRSSILLIAILSIICTAKTFAQTTSPVAVVVSPPSKDSFDIYLLMGQSNMVGRDTTTLPERGNIRAAIINFRVSAVADVPED